MERGGRALAAAYRHPWPLMGCAWATKASPPPEASTAAGNELGQRGYAARRPERDLEGSPDTSRGPRGRVSYHVPPTAEERAASHAAP